MRFPFPAFVFAVGCMHLIAGTEMVLVEGGNLPAYMLGNPHNRFGDGEVAAFQIGKYEVTWAEWKQVRDWAVDHGYPELAKLGTGKGPNHPVTGINWFDAVKWCNAKSEMEGLEPVYSLNGMVYRSGDFASYKDGAVEALPAANGYRLPSSLESTWATIGGATGKSYSEAAKRKIGAVGMQKPNGLGLYDLNGNAWEWCEKGRSRGWGQGASSSTGCALPREGRHDNKGLRLARNAP